MDKLISGIAGEGNVRVYAAVTTNILTEAVRRHDTSPTASAAFGRVLTGTLLLAASQKEFDRLSVRIESDGPIGGMLAEATKDLNVRGYVRNPEADVPPKADGKFDVSGVVGSGTFYVIRESGFDIGLHREPYVGSVPIVSGEIAEDFAYYLAKSEQIPSAVMLGVLLGKSEPFVIASGGVMVQMLPGVNQHLITMIEDNIAHAPHVTSIIREGATPQELAKLALGEIDFEELAERDISFQCNCSHERAITLISSLGRDEVESMLREDGGAEMTCGFCNEKYTLGAADLEDILQTI